MERLRRNQASLALARDVADSFRNLISGQGKNPLPHDHLGATTCVAFPRASLRAADTLRAFQYAFFIAISPATHSA